MGVAICDVDALMPHAIGNRQRCKTHINQQTYVAVAKVMDIRMRFTPVALLPLSISWWR